MEDEPKMTLAEQKKHWLEIRKCTDAELRGLWDWFEAEVNGNGSKEDVSYYRQMRGIVIGEYLARGLKVEIIPPKK
jgi:hypothetical protein